MSKERNGQELFDALGAFGADLSRWPLPSASAARAALLADPVFRIAWEKERELDFALLGIRETLDKEAARSGAIGRVRRSLLAQLPTDPLAGLSWRKVAAAMLAAGMLGGAMDLFLPDAPAMTPDLVMLDPLSGFDESDLQ